MHIVSCPQAKYLVSGCHICHSKAFGWPQHFFQPMALAEQRRLNHCCAKDLETLRERCLKLFPPEQEEAKTRWKSRRLSITAASPVQTQKRQILVATEASASFTHTTRFQRAPLGLAETRKPRHLLPPQRRRLWPLPLRGCGWSWPCTKRQHPQGTRQT